MKFALSTNERLPIAKTLRAYLAERDTRLPKRSHAATQKDSLLRWSGRQHGRQQSAGYLRCRLREIRIIPKMREPCDNS